MLEELRLIEIELHSYCNRKCPWCPNSKIDRSFYEELPEDIFIKILEDLKRYNYTNIISFTRYNEPMSNMDLLIKRIDQTREYFPKNVIKFNTNGDFLTKRNVEDLDINVLNINDYDYIGMDEAKKRLITLGILPLYSHKNVIIGMHKNIEKIAYRTNWPDHQHMHDRGGYLKEIYPSDKREYICNQMILSMHVDYNGLVMPCCNMRSDIESHKDFVLGDLHEQGIVDIYSSEKYKSLSNILMSGNYDELPEPCKFCNKDDRQCFYVR